VLEWAQQHRAQLSPDGGPCAFEFSLHALAFIELLTGGAQQRLHGDARMHNGGGGGGAGDAAAALAYAKANFPPFQVGASGVLRAAVGALGLCVCFSVRVWGIGLVQREHATATPLLFHAQEAPSATSPDQPSPRTPDRPPGQPHAGHTALHGLHRVRGAPPPADAPPIRGAAIGGRGLGGPGGGVYQAGVQPDGAGALSNLVAMAAWGENPPFLVGLSVWSLLCALSALEHHSHHIFLTALQSNPQPPTPNPAPPKTPKAAESPLAVVVAAGSASLPVLVKMATVMDRSGQPYDSCEQLPTDIHISPEFIFHSTFACPVSKEQATAENPPKLLPCGHVLCEQSITKIADRSRTRVFKCPYCPMEARADNTRTLIFPDVI